MNRRCFLRQSMIGIGVVAVGGSVVFPYNGPSGAFGYPAIPNATMVVMHNSALCIGCRRCEVACSTMREGASQPSRARVFIDRRYQESIWTDGQFTGETCRQCEEAPCLRACPAEAIKVDEKTKARYVDLKVCNGLGNCQRACPFNMVNYFEDERKARKCDLCGGAPECVKQCPATALRYVKWDPRYDDLD